MQLFLKIMLILHIIGGFTALFVAPIALVVKKGGKQHRRWGKVYFWGMTLVIITAIFISVLKNIPFLLMVSFFSYHSIVNGYRSIYHKKLHKTKKPAALDWFIQSVAAVFNVALLAWGIYVITSSKASVGYIATVFGVIGITSTITGIKGLLRPPKKHYAWFLNHMGGMIGGYIATVTAFSAVNFGFMPALYRWLWPTILGVPLLLMWQRYYSRKFEGKLKKKPATVSAES